MLDPSGNRGIESNYLGLAPGFIGVYQINVKMPDELRAPVEIHVQRSRDCGFFFLQGCGRGVVLDFSAVASIVR